jgi:Zn-dependent protease with chaperone function
MIDTAKPASPTRRPLLVVAIPLILLALGGWQIIRGIESVSEFAQNKATLAKGLVGLDVIAKLAPEQVIQFRGDPRTYSASEAAEMLRGAGRKVGWEELAARVRLRLAVAGATGAALGLLAGLTGLAVAAWARQQSGRSRATVEIAFSRVRLMLPWILAGQIGGMTLALGGAGFFEMIGLALYGELGSQTGRAVQWGLVFTGAVVWLGWLALRELRRSLRAFTPAPMPIFGRPVPRAEAPGLWRMIDGLAAGQGAAGPEHVVVGLSDGFFVTSSDLNVLPGRVHMRGRTLYLPLPQLAMLDAHETEAVIAHELAHFAGEDTIYSTRFLPIYAGIGRNLTALSGTGPTARWTQAPAVILGTHIMAVFDMAVKHWSRVRELEADAASRRPSGPQAPARALIRTALISSVVRRVMAEAAAKPQAAAPDLVEAMVERAAQDGFPDPSAALSDRQPHPTDTHPPTIARIEALGLTADEYLLSRAARPVQRDALDSASGLFADWTALCRDLSADAMTLATAQHDLHEALLRRIAAQRTEGETKVFQDVRAAIWLAPLGLLFGWIGVKGVYSAIATHGAKLTTVLAMVACAVAGGLVLWRMVIVMRSRHIPYLTLTADGFVCRGLDRMVPWIGVERVNMVAGQLVNLSFHLNAMTTLPLAPNQPVLFKPVRINAKRRIVTTIGRPRGMKPKALLDLIGRYLSAAQAQAALDARVADQVYSAVPAEDDLRVAAEAGTAC